MNLFNVFVLLLVVFHANIMNAQSVKDSVKVLFSKDIPQKYLIPSDYLELNISFVEEPPYSSRGFWFFKKEKLLLKIKLTNNSNRPYYIPSIFYKNPSFSLIKNGNQSIGKNFDIIHPAIDLDFFHKLNPKDSYEKIINVQEMYDFDFGEGQYILTASFYSKYGKLIINEKEYPIWNGSIDSNSLTFSVD